MRSFESASRPTSYTGVTDLRPGAFSRSLPHVYVQIKSNSRSGRYEVVHAGGLNDYTFFLLSGSGHNIHDIGVHAERQV